MAKKEKKSKAKKSFYKRWWFIGLVVIVLLSAILGSGNDDNDTADGDETNETTSTDTESSTDNESSDKSEEEVKNESNEEIDPIQAHNDSIKEGLDNPIILEGTGKTATDKITTTFPISVAKLSHQGNSNFIVKLFDSNNTEELMVNEIGSYSGIRPITGEGEYMFDVNADGAWKIEITPIQRSKEVAFEGRGDFVSTIFDVPKTGAWEFSHDGESNFIVKLHTEQGTSLILNEIGASSGSQIVKFPSSGIGLWEVQADGNWSLKPRE